MYPGRSLSALLGLAGLAAGCEVVHFIGENTRPACHLDSECELAAVCDTAAGVCATPAATANLDILFVIVCAVIGLWALRRYLFLLMHAEEVANQATCPTCQGSRLREATNHVKIAGRTISELVHLPIAECLGFFQTIELNEHDRKIAERLLKEIDGMLMKKKNTFYDFIDVAEALQRGKWSSPARTVIEGGSAGGLLMGAVVNLRPELFKAVHAAVPFVDVMNTMMDASLPLTVGEYLEWGNPNEKPAYDYMRSYSPYENLAKQAYPAMLVTTSYNDSQVMYWEPAKYVARLRTLKTDANPLLLKIRMEPAGHGGASGRYDALRDKAFEMAWMLQQVGVTP